MIDDRFLQALITAKIRLLRLHHEARHGHIGGDFSCIDALMTLHHLVMAPDDRFILSKGHSAAALYVTLWSLGQISEADLSDFCRDGTRLAAHPGAGCVPGVLFSTGSLGHGASLAAGLALAAKSRSTDRRVYCLCSDGEWQEGSSWEALSFAVHHGLDNLCILLDLNGWQAFGRTAEVACPSKDLERRLAAFGAETALADGHNPVEILRFLGTRPSGAPKVLLLKTVKGKNLHFADRLESHYLPLTQEQYEYALARLEMRP